MSKNTKKTAGRAQELMTLDAFCARLSETERRYALISGFRAAMILEKRTRASEATYRNLFTDFAGRPA